MNNRGSVSIFLVIIIAAILSVFILFINILSVKSFENNIKRSLVLTSRDILADYDDYIYDSYGILSYKKYNKEMIADIMISKYNNFKSPLNIYEIEDIEINYNTENIKNKELLMNQILIFSKNNVTLEYIEYIANQNNVKEKYMNKMNEIKSKLSKNKYYNKIKKTQKKILSDRINFDNINAIRSDYSNLFSELDEKIRYLRGINNSGNEMLGISIKKLEAEYLNEYDSIKKQEKIVNEIEKLLNLEINDEIDNKLKEEYKKFETLVDVESSSESYINVINNIKNEINELKQEVGIGLIESSLELNENNSLELEYFNKLFLNEYILGTFKTVANSNIRNFQLYNKNTRDYISNSEVEYIINGNSNPIINNLKISSKIMLIRETMNLMHLFIDNDKREFILTSAKIPAGGIFAAAGLTVIWSGAESVVDIVKLYSGNGTPLLKISDKDFVLDLGVIQNGTKIDFKNHNDNTFLYYNDYLRMFLLTVDENNLVNRMLQIIDLNYKKINEFNSLNNLILKHEIDIEVNLKNKLTGNNKLYDFTITEGYVDE
ncbi:DUF5702 domain-containing protein [Clostridiaceae bacterium HSG29]|nr:DUF5702 domain-containing protein [Clostridiaceae bacterium HSG29]